jgi:transposase
MSLQPQLFYLVPEETARIARAAFPHGNVSMRLYDTLGIVFRDQDFASLFSPTGQPAESPVRVALATILRFAEGLSDRQAADAVRSRIDWKYLLCLELTDSGFDQTVLSEFRTRLLEGEAALLLFDTLRKSHSILHSLTNSDPDFHHVRTLSGILYRTLLNLAMLEFTECKRFALAKEVWTSRVSVILKLLVYSFWVEYGALGRWRITACLSEAWE